MAIEKRNSCTSFVPKLTHENSNMNPDKETGKTPIKERCVAKN